jgi:uncharacterized membrane protein
MPIWTHFLLVLLAVVVMTIVVRLLWPQLDFPVGPLNAGLGAIWFTFVVNRKRQHG